MFADSANFGQMLTLLEGSLYNNVIGQEENYTQLSKDALAYLIAYTFSIGENLSNSTMLAGAGKLIDDTRSIIKVFNLIINKAAKEVASGLHHLLYQQ